MNLNSNTGKGFVRQRLAIDIEAKAKGRPPNAKEIDDAVVDFLESPNQTPFDIKSLELLRKSFKKLVLEIKKQQELAFEESHESEKFDKLKSRFTVRTDNKAQFALNAQKAIRAHLKKVISILNKAGYAYEPKIKSLHRPPEKSYLSSSLDEMAINGQASSMYLVLSTFLDIPPNLARALLNSVAAPTSDIMKHGVDVFPNLRASSKELGFDPGPSKVAELDAELAALQGAGRWVRESPKPF